MYVRQLCLTSEWGQHKPLAPGPITHKCQIINLHTPLNIRTLCMRSYTHSAFKIENQKIVHTVQIYQLLVLFFSILACSHSHSKCNVAPPPEWSQRDTIWSCDVVEFCAGSTLSGDCKKAPRSDATRACEPNARWTRRVLISAQTSPSLASFISSAFLRVPHHAGPRIADGTTSGTTLVILLTFLL